jgi:hypothetical protein
MKERFQVIEVLEQLAHDGKVAIWHTPQVL